MKESNPNNTEEITLEELLQSLSSTDNFRLFEFLIQEKTGTRRLIQEWFQREKGIALLGADDPLLDEYWNEAKQIIDEIRDSHGKMEEKDDDLLELLEQISTLGKKGKLSAPAKLDFINDAFGQIMQGTCGLEEPVMDTLFAICATPDEWTLLLKHLRGLDWSWFNILAEKILRDHLPGAGELQQEPAASPDSKKKGKSKKRSSRENI